MTEFIDGPEQDPTVRIQPLDPADDVPRAIVAPATAADRLFRGLLRGGGLVVLGIMGFIAVFLAIKAAPAFNKVGFRFFTNFAWNPSTTKFGVGAILVDGIEIAAIAVLIAWPVAIGLALFISEYAPGVLRRRLIALVDLMAAIPSIIYALWGVYFLVPRTVGPLRWVSAHLGFIPVLKVRGTGTAASYTGSVFVAGLVVSLMVIPIIASISREVFSQAPQGEREGAYALGASRFAMIRTVVLPYGRGGVIGATMLGLGRAMGEATVVSLLVTPVYKVVTHILESGGYSIPSLILLRYGESTTEMISGLMAAGLVLFAVTLLVNIVAGIVVARTRSGALTAD
jgi:phosphate transport system permease protein